MVQLLTDSASIHKWCFSSVALITYNSVANNCNFYIICTFKGGNKVLTLTCVLKLFDSYRFTRFSLFWFFNPISSVKFSSCLLAGNTYVHASYLFSARADLFFFFQSGVLVFCRNIVFWFLSSQFSVRCTYSSWSQLSLWLVTRSMFLLSFSLILSLIPVLKPSFLIFISALFLFFAPGSSCKIGILSSTFCSL